MECKYFGFCGSCRVYEIGYSEQVERKKEYMSELFGLENFDFFTSESEHYRDRAEFRIWHDGDDISYGMHRLEGGGVLKIDECPKVSRKIFELMPRLRDYIQKNEELRVKLYSIEFLSCESSILVTLIYHKPLFEKFQDEAKKLEKSLDISIIGRAKKIKVVASQDYITQTLHVENQKYIYKILEGGFSQPNSKVNEKMLGWVVSHVKNGRDLLELYCGHGNFTIPLSSRFFKVLATEISKTSIKSALYNCQLNGISNIKFLRMSVEELTSALKKEREFKRLVDIKLEEYDFSHIFVDPPRAGIDEKSLKFISKFENIIYISCNPETLKRDLDILKKDFKVVDFAVFDQFPHTNHIESGIILKK